PAGPGTPAGPRAGRPGDHWSNLMLTRADLPEVIAKIRLLRGGLYDPNPSEDALAPITQDVCRRLAVEFSDELPTGLRVKLDQLHEFTRRNWNGRLAIDARLPRRRDEICAFLDGLLAELCQAASAGPTPVEIMREVIGKVQKGAEQKPEAL